MKILAALLTIGFLLFPVHQSFAQETTAPIGTIAEIEGIVAIERNSEAIVPAVGDPIFLNESLETGPDSKALIVFIDDSELTLGENASLNVNDYIFESENLDANKGRFSILRGAFIFVSGLISKKENPDVKIETTYGSIGLRGTVVWGGTLDDQYNVFVQEGEVFFSTERGRVTLRPGQGTFVQSRRSIPSRAKAWGQDKIGRAVQTVSLKNPDRAKSRVLEIKQKHQKMRGDHSGDIQENQRLKNDRIEEKKQERHDNRKNMNREYRPDTPAKETKQETGEIKQQEPEDKKATLQERLLNHEEKRAGQSEPIKQRIMGDTPQEIERSERLHLRRKSK